VRIAVIGHVEWVEFAEVESFPTPGEIVHAAETWAEAAGAGAVASVQLANLGAETTFFTTIGDDELGRQAREQLEGQGVRVRSAAVGPTRRAFTHIDQTGERTITVLGEKYRPGGDNESFPWHELKDVDGVYFVSGDVQALRRARTAPLLVAAARDLGTLRFGSVQLDALVGSALDAGERYEPDSLDPPPHLVVATSSHLGGWAQPGGPFEAADKPGPVKDSYGAGDCFAAGLTFALARGDDSRDALALAARCGATVVTGKGPYGRMLGADDL
jgi:ribokinase